MNEITKKIIIKHFLLGALFGLLFPLIAYSYELSKHYTHFELNKIIDMHRKFPMLYMIDTAPFFLGLFALIVGIQISKVYNLNFFLEKNTGELTSSKEKLEKLTQILKNKNEALYKTSMIDSLTGLENEKILLDKIRKDIKTDIVLCVLNICHFREINVNFGEDIGNNLLIEFAKRLKENNFECYRLHSDEFAIVYYGNANFLEIDVFSNYLFDLISNTSFQVNNQFIYLTIHMGFATSNNNLRNEYDMQRLLHNAYFALKYSRERRLQYILYTPELLKQTGNNYSYYWKEKIINSVKSDRIVSFFQPIINNKTKSSEKYEALIRIIDSDGSYINPYSFITSSKQYGLYGNLTRIMINKAFEALISSNSEVSINISIDDIRDISTMKLLLKKLEKFPKDKSNKIVFELLESEGIENYDDVKDFIKKVKVYNCKIAIDDFGSGYSNFSHILNLDIDYIKIDASIIKNIDKDKNSEYIAKLIVDFAKKIGIKTIAEFVHSKSIFDKVREIGIDYSQGYYFAEPQREIIPIINNI